MSYPGYIMVNLVEINGNSCGELSQRVAWVANATPPKYSRSGTGDFIVTTITQTLVGGTTTWQMAIRNLKAGACMGNFVLLRATADDDPTGDFYVKNAAGEPDSSLGVATAVNDD